MSNVVFWMYEVGWRANERIGEGNGVRLPRGLPAGKQLEGRREGWQSGPPGTEGRGAWRAGGDCIGSPWGLPRGAHQDFPRESVATTLAKVHWMARQHGCEHPAEQGVSEWNDVGLPMGSAVLWMYEVGWRGSERIGEGMKGTAQVY